MIPLYVKRCAIYNEFTKKELEQYFGRSEKGVRPHVDTLYYCVSIVGDAKNTENQNLYSFIDGLREAREEKRASPEKAVMFYGLSVKPYGVNLFEYGLSEEEMFDIFIASNLLNDDTPRIVVQIRSRSLVLDGVDKSLEKSFVAVCRVLDAYSLSVDKTRENRFDYAFHTNMIQNPTRYFSDNTLRKSLRTSLRRYSKIGEIGTDIDIQTFCLGTRKSQKTFMRIYDKTREVIEEGYKSFFIPIWLDAKLISPYDAYVIEKAYTMKAYKTGLLVGRIDWYLEFGGNEERKEQLRALRRSCYENSDNADHIEKELDGVLPPVTTVMNVEFQTKRAFYRSFDKTIDRVELAGEFEPKLEWINKIFLLRPVFLDFLTSNMVAFVKDRKDKESSYLDWWNRIRTCKLENGISNVTLVRETERNANMEKARKRLLADFAAASIILNGSDKDTGFVEDAADMLCYLNDNDFYGFSPTPDGVPVRFRREGEYTVTKKRKNRQLKGIVHTTERMK